MPPPHNASCLPICVHRLTGRSLGDTAVKAVAEALRRGRTVQWLDLTNNCITTHGVQELAEVMLNHPSLTTVSLAGNDLDDQAMFFLEEVLLHNPKMKTISVHDNSMVTARGYQTIHNAEKAKKQRASSTPAFAHVVEDGDADEGQDFEVEQQQGRENPGRLLTWDLAGPAIPNEGASSSTGSPVNTSTDAESHRASMHDDAFGQHDSMQVAEQDALIEQLLDEQAESRRLIESHRTQIESQRTQIESQQIEMEEMARLKEYVVELQQNASDERARLLAQLKRLESELSWHKECITRLYRTRQPDNATFGRDNGFEAEAEVSGAQSLEAQLTRQAELAESMLRLNLRPTLFAEKVCATDSNGNPTQGRFGRLFRSTFSGHMVALKEVGDVRQRPGLRELVHGLKAPLSRHHGDKRVLREVAILASIRHPNVVQFLGVCYDEAEKTLFFVLSWADNGSLFDFMYVKRRKLSHIDRLRILSEVAGAMEFLHAHDVVHRDLKSPNVLLDAVLSAKVADFGLSTFKNTETSSLSRVTGTPLWASPEQLLSKKLRSDTDVFSFGCLAWEVWFAVKPWHHGEYERDGVSLVQLALKYDKHEYLPLEEEINGQEMPVHLRALLRGCFTTSGSRLSFAQLHAALRAQYCANKEHEPEPLDFEQQTRLLYGRPDAVWKFDPDILATLGKKKHALSTRDTVYVVPLDLENQDEASIVKTLLRQAGGRTARQPDLLGPFGRKVAAAGITWCDQKLAAFNGAVHRNKTRFRGHLRNTSHPFAPKYRHDTSTGFATLEEERYVLEQVTMARHYKMLDLQQLFANPQLRIQRVFHGVKSFDAAVGILGSDFARLRMTDDGWFGAGLYFTPDLDYALAFTQECDGADVPADLQLPHLKSGKSYRIVLACDVQYGNPYPVTKHSVHPQATSHERMQASNSFYTFRNKPLVAGHDAHVAVVDFQRVSGDNDDNVDNVRPFDSYKDWEHPDANPVAEILLSDPSCVLVRAVLVFDAEHVSSSEATTTQAEAQYTGPSTASAPHTHQAGIKR
ncbi:TKL protein kinase, variant [Salpingoeca rosetta]|uniref:TKL protein kinase, variant n=1 Tax=Salpingoeca rosetta (strain ATCC 50818 / BSB-021) TaxID=946362 RepID=F2U8J4_SALR5|nr:TKL protein kinase, variant [Salpingoeca rosetta]EGD72701.1 TKL protein kinase, variant [Salpingoeca rosetta]|eukprot:XP_004994524.1 TKL protein kinase, variant [Salpingoeca rosetta]